MASKKQQELTSDNIKKVHIIATLDDGRHIMALSEDKMLIKVITSYCQFVKLKDDLFGQCSLKELME